MKTIQHNHPKIGTFQCHTTRDIGPSVRICQLNIEGISGSKSDHLARLLKETNVDVIALQETHCADEAQLLLRGKINGFSLVGAHYHRSYGIATYVKSSIENVRLIEIKEDKGIYLITIDIAELKISNLYMPISNLAGHLVLSQNMSIQL